MMGTYFISHAPDGRKVAEAIDQFLENQGMKGVLYERDFHQNEDFIADITKALVESDGVICLITPKFITSLWCAKEFLTALNAHKLIAIFLEDCTTTKLGSIHWNLDLRNVKEEEQLEILKNNLLLLIDRLHPRLIDYKEAFAFIERITVILPRFGVHPHVNDNVAFEYQIRAAKSLQQDLSSKNVLINPISQLVDLEEHANSLLESTFADIVVYGLMGNFGNDGYVSFGLTTTRGWTFEREGIPHQILDMEMSWKTNVILAGLIKTGIGNLEHARFRQEKAKILFKEVMKAIDQNLVFSDIFVVINTGRFYLKLGLIKEAQSLFEKAIYMDPRYPESYELLGHAFIRLGEFEKAFDAYDKERLASMPFGGADLVFFGRIPKLSRSKGQYDHQLTDFVGATRFNETDANVYRKRGDAYLHLGEVEKALSDYERCLQIKLETSSFFGYDTELAAKIAELKAMFGKQ